MSQPRELRRTQQKRPQLDEALDDLRTTQRSVVRRHADDANIAPLQRCCFCRNRGLTPGVQGQGRGLRRAQQGSDSCFHEPPCFQEDSGKRAAVALDSGAGAARNAYMRIINNEARLLHPT